MRGEDGAPISNAYAVYGLGIHSDMPLSLPLETSETRAHVRIRSRSQRFFAAVVARTRFTVEAPSWFQYGRLVDGSTYLRWDRLGEFLVSADGGSIACRPFDDASAESFQVYLLQRALSLALVKQGFEPLHATAVVTDGRAIAFLGRGGFGKSSLAAVFLRAGDALLTDDLLLVRRTPAGPRAYPGPARIKLFPAMARRLLGAQSTGVPMNPDTNKLVMRLEPAQVWTTPVPLAALYVLPSPRLQVRRIRVEPLEPRRAFVEIVRHSLSALHADPDRLVRQFVEASSLAADVPVKQMLHSRRLDQLADVRRALLADLGAN